MPAANTGTPTRHLWRRAVKGFFVFFSPLASSRRAIPSVASRRLEEATSSGPSPRRRRRHARPRADSRRPARRRRVRVPCIAHARAAGRPSATRRGWPRSAEESRAQAAERVSYGRHTEARATASYIFATASSISDQQTINIRIIQVTFQTFVYVSRRDSGVSPRARYSSCVARKSSKTS